MMVEKDLEDGMLILCSHSSPTFYPIVSHESVGEKVWGEQEGSRRERGLQINKTGWR